MPFCCLLIFFSKSSLLKSYFRYTIRVSNNSYPDQAQCFVRPDLTLITVCKSYQQVTLVGKELSMFIEMLHLRHLNYIVRTFTLEKIVPQGRILNTGHHIIYFQEKIGTIAGKNKKDI